MNPRSTFKTELFSTEEQQEISALINGCSHRYEFKQLIKHLHNEQENPHVRLWSLLRYVDQEQRHGLFSLLKVISTGKCIEQILMPDFIKAMMD
ncbi:hypothetical protein V8050_003584 [Vibrio parahaemolyticus]|uniref:hypothetical protein n=1 Tax=Vibrio parahaemolyticus TaxID=670 RepID=UPI0009B5DB43|nr:hypothetical protein [Vibrio parahaemolyticus]EII2984879.1 hypothetical protein [Vibrio parahaemolyticus]EII2986379.1 hypothetical protein [Vibrio parahaemolyticus]EJG0710517.1 hypothetical protein [Vibrio parahaemolyticus]MCZ5867748.1 hypothetical protein [Vibrio parahaemolyticus]MCZ5897744.1 hypothetical protein [Vibrio parahaemolyticus]